MSEHLRLGALEKETGNYVYPLIARKGIKYACPSCERDVIFKAGAIKKPYFAHKKSTSPCFYYDRPNETQIHKEGKQILDRVLRDKRSFEVLRECKHCFTRNALHVMFSSEEYENTESKIEYRFVFNEKTRVADVALLKDSNLFAVFEVLHSHATLEGDRPEPWFEFRGIEIIEECNKQSDTMLQLRCVRQYKCNECIQREKKEEQRRLVYLQEQEEKQLKEAEELQERRRQVAEKEQAKQKLREEKRLEKQTKDEQTLEHYDKHINEMKVLFEEKYKEEVERSNLELRVKMQKNECACGLLKENMCKCLFPKYEQHRFTGNMVCVCCKKWKCRC